MRTRGARLLASRAWCRLRELAIAADDRELAKLARAACWWPALEGVFLVFSGAKKLTLKKVRRWAPQVAVLQFL